MFNQHRQKDEKLSKPQFQPGNRRRAKEQSRLKREGGSEKLQGIRTWSADQGRDQDSLNPCQNL